MLWIWYLHIHHHHHLQNQDQDIDRQNSIGCCYRHRSSHLLSIEEIHNRYLEDWERGEKGKVVWEMGVREFQNMIPYYPESRTGQMWFWRRLQDSRQEHIHCPN